MRPAGGGAHSRHRRRHAAHAAPGGYGAGQVGVILGGEPDEVGDGAVIGVISQFAEYCAAGLDGPGQPDGNIAPARIGAGQRHIAPGGGNSVDGVNGLLKQKL